MQIDLYTLYLFSYSKEFLFNSKMDITKINSFSVTSNVIFIDDFLKRDVLANNPIEFFLYLKKRQCFKVEIGKLNDSLVMYFYCRYSKEIWGLDSSDENCNKLVFKKINENLWISRYMNISESEVNDIRKKLKINSYKG